MGKWEREREIQYWNTKNWPSRREGLGWEDNSEKACQRIESQETKFFIQRESLCEFDMLEPQDIHRKTGEYVEMLDEEKTEQIRLHCLNISQL